MRVVYLKFETNAFENDPIAFKKYDCNFLIVEYTRKLVLLKFASLSHQTLQEILKLVLPFLLTQVDMY